MQDSETAMVTMTEKELAREQFAAYLTGVTRTAAAVRGFLTDMADGDGEVQQGEVERVLKAILMTTIDAGVAEDMFSEELTESMRDSIELDKKGKEN